MLKMEQKTESFSHKDRVQKFLRKNSIIKIVCNSGGLQGRIIGFNRHNFQNSAVVSLVKVIPNGKLKKGEIHQCIITSLKYPFHINGIGVFRFPENCGVLINKVGKEWKLLGTSVLSPVSSMVLVDKKIGSTIVEASQGVC